MIFLVGPHGAGKTESAKLLAEIGFVTIDLGPTLRSIHKQDHTNLEFIEWIQQGELVSGNNFTEVLLAKELNKLKATLDGFPTTDIVIVGSRGRSNVEYIEKKVPKINGFDRLVIFVDAPFETLQQRYNTRDNKDLTKEEFRKLLDTDNELGLGSLCDITDVNIINNGTLDDLKDKLKKIVVGRGYTKVTSYADHL